MSRIAGAAADVDEISSDDGDALQADKYIQGTEPTPYVMAMNLTAKRHNKYL